jgi:excisionase family DNA binding protein
MFPLDDELAAGTNSGFLSRYQEAIEGIYADLDIEIPGTWSSEQRVNLLFLGFLRAAARFGIFQFGPLTIHLDPVEQRVAESVSKPHGTDQYKTVMKWVELLQAERQHRGSRAIDELHVLLAFMKLGAGVPAEVFGELGVTPDQVEAYAASPDSPHEVDLIEPLYSPEEAAAYLKVHVQTVREWIRSGRLPAYRLAGQKSFRIAARDLKKVLQPYRAGAD